MGTLASTHTHTVPIYQSIFSKWKQKINKNWNIKDWGRTWKFGYVALVDCHLFSRFPSTEQMNEKGNLFVNYLPWWSHLWPCARGNALINSCKCVFYRRLFNSFLIVCWPLEWRCAVNCIMIGGPLACLSGVGEHSSPATRDVDVQDVHWSHREAAVTQLAVPKGDGSINVVQNECCFIQNPIHSIISSNIVICKLNLRQWNGCYIYMSSFCRCCFLGLYFTSMILALANATLYQLSYRN